MYAIRYSCTLYDTVAHLLRRVNVLLPHLLLTCTAALPPRVPCGAHLMMRALFPLLLAASSGGGGIASAAAAGKLKPNILWVLTDDQDIELGGTHPVRSAPRGKYRGMLVDLMYAGLWSLGTGGDQRRRLSVAARAAAARHGATTIIYNTII